MPTTTSTREYKSLFYPWPKHVTFITYTACALRGISRQQRCSGRTYKKRRIMEIQNISWTLPGTTFGSCSYHVKRYLKTTQITRETTIMHARVPLCLKSTFKVKACVLLGIKTEGRRPTHIFTTLRLGEHWDAGNAAHAGQSSAGFCVSHVWICQRELRGRAGQGSTILRLLSPEPHPFKSHWEVHCT